MRRLPQFFFFPPFDGLFFPPLRLPLEFSSCIFSSLSMSSVLCFLCPVLGYLHLLNLSFDVVHCFWKMYGHYLFKYFFCFVLSLFSYWVSNYKCLMIWYCPTALQCSVLLSFILFFSECLHLGDFYWPIFKFTDSLLSQYKSTELTQGIPVKIFTHAQGWPEWFFYPLGIVSYVTREQAGKQSASFLSGTESRSPGHHPQGWFFPASHPAPSLLLWAPTRTLWERFCE